VLNTTGLIWVAPLHWWHRPLWPIADNVDGKFETWNELVRCHDAVPPGSSQL